MANMEFQNQVETFVLKARHAFLNCDYQTVVGAIENAIAACGTYFRALPNYYELSEKAQLIAFVSDAYALHALANLFLQRFDAAFESIETAISYLPETLYRIIKCMVLAGSGEYEGAIRALRVGSAILDRAYLENECVVGDANLRVFRLLASSATSDHERTYRALAAVLEREELTVDEFLAAEECARLACEQFHQTPIQLKADRTLKYPGIGPANELVNLQDLEFHCFQQYKRLGGNLAEPGVLLEPQQIVEMCFKPLHGFKMASFSKYVDTRVFKTQFQEKHAAISRRFMGMVKLSGNKHVKSDQLILTEEALREYLWNTVAAKENENTNSRPHSANSRSSSQSISQINAQNERAAQELKRRKDRYLAPLALFPEQERLQAAPFTSHANVDALTTRNASMLRPAYHLNKTENKAEFVVGNGKFNTTTRLINKKREDLSVESVLRVYDRLPSNEIFQRVKQPAMTTEAHRNCTYSCDVCKQKPNAAVENGDRLAITDKMKSTHSIVENQVNSELENGSLTAHTFGIKSNVENYNDSKALDERLRRVRALQLSQKNDAILNTYKSKLASSQLLATNYDDFSKVLYIHDKPRPREIVFDENFNDLFDQSRGCHKCQSFDKITLNLGNLPRADTLAKFRAVYDSFEAANTTDGDLDGRGLLERLKLFDIAQIQAYQANAAAGQDPIPQTPRAESSIVPAYLKIQFDQIVAANQARSKAPHNSKPKPTTKTYKNVDLLSKENPCAQTRETQYKYFRTNKTSFLFGTQ